MLPTEEMPNAGRFIQQQIEALRRTDLEVQVLYVKRRQKGVRAYVGLPSELRSAVAVFNPDLVHVMYGGIMSGLVTHFVRDRPVLVTFHGSDLLGQPFERPLRRLFSACGVLASRQAARRCDGIIAVAEHLLKSLPKAIPKSKIQVIPCGIDLNLFEPKDRVLCRERLGWSQDIFHVLYQNSGDPVKRPELAYAAVKRLKDLGVNAELHELRGVPYEQVPIWLNASDALLVTSYHEGSPTIVKEALACNLPIVSVAVGDIPSRIKNIEGCHLSAPVAMELAANLSKVSTAPARIDGRNTVSSVSVDRCARLLSQFYEHILWKKALSADVTEL